MKHTKPTLATHEGATAYTRDRAGGGFAVPVVRRGGAWRTEDGEVVPDAQVFDQQTGSIDGRSPRRKRRARRIRVNEVTHAQRTAPKDDE